MWTVMDDSNARSLKVNQGKQSLTDVPGSDFAAVWSSVVAELNGSPDSSGDYHGAPLDPPLTPQQRAWLKLVHPR